MARQARAEVTRGKIIDAAVELFTDSGYGDTDLAAIVRRAGITKGAFYYHFESKEQVADAIVAEGNIRLRKVFSDADESSSSALESLILATFGVARLMRTDQLVGTGNLLIQSLSQVGHTGYGLYPDWVEVFTGYCTTAVRRDRRRRLRPAGPGLAGADHRGRPGRVGVLLPGIPGPRRRAVQPARAVLVQVVPH